MPSTTPVSSIEALAIPYHAAQRHVYVRCVGRQQRCNRIFLQSAVQCKAQTQDNVYMKVYSIHTISS
jgi:hypothetical protein